MARMCQWCSSRGRGEHPPLKRKCIRTNQYIEVVKTYFGTRRRVTTSYNSSVLMHIFRRNLCSVLNSVVEPKAVDWRTDCVSVEFPLRGEWTAVVTPAHRVPSHGTDFLAQRYAFDFVAIREGSLFNGGSKFWKHLFGRVPAKECHGWSQTVFSPFAGRIADVKDGWPDRSHVNLMLDVLRCHVFTPTVSNSDLRPLLGNYVIVESTNVVVLLAHLEQGTIEVDVGRHIKAGQAVAKVGLSGNSTIPHLHLQLMDSPEPIKARAVPCCFASYERWTGSNWEKIKKGIPQKDERLRVAFNSLQQDLKLNEL